MVYVNHRNKTRITEFLLLGFEIHQSLKKLLFFWFLVLYIMTVSGNVLMIALFLRTPQLHSPMYFFLCHLSLSDIFLSTNIAPNFLRILLGDGKNMAVNGCIIQFFASSGITAIECLLLTVMSYDRYLAICNPLHYIRIMNINICFHLSTWSWFLGFLLSLIFTVPVSLLEFCGCNIIDHVYCDLAPLLDVSCSDTSFIDTETIIVSIPFIISQFLFIIYTYINIFLTILKISSSTGRKKAFSTCSSHLTVVSTFYGTLIAKYVVPSKGHSLHLNKVISLLYTVATPLLNPIIYSLRNQQIRTALSKCLS